MIRTDSKSSHFGGKRSRKDNRRQPAPIAEITRNIMIRKCTSKESAKLISVSSSRINHNPLLRRNETAFACSSFLHNRKTETPDRKTKVGAHKCVIQRVKNRTPEVVLKSKGFCVREVRCSKSRTWSRAIMIMTKPLTVSIDSIRFSGFIFGCILMVDLPKACKHLLLQVKVFTGGRIKQ